MLSRSWHPTAIVSLLSSHTMSSQSHQCEHTLTASRKTLALLEKHPHFVHNPPSRAALLSHNCPILSYLPSPAQCMRIAHSAAMRRISRHQGRKVEGNSTALPPAQPTTQSAKQEPTLYEALRAAAAAGASAAKESHPCARQFLRRSVRARKQTKMMNVRYN